VLEPLGGYLRLAERLATKGVFNASAFNFGPLLEANRPVRQLIEDILEYWPGAWEVLSNSNAVHEAGLLHLQIDKALHLLGWQPHWTFAITVRRTVAWYQAVHKGNSPLNCCIEDLRMYEK
jgi:CDP-glucose 4,6-dehydratase